MAAWLFLATLGGVVSSEFMPRSVWVWDLPDVVFKMIPAPLVPHLPALIVSAITVWKLRKKGSLAGKKLKFKRVTTTHFMWGLGGVALAGHAIEVI